MIKSIRNLTFFILLLVPCIIYAQSPQFNVSQYRGGFNGEKLTISSSSIGLTNSVYNPVITNTPSAQSRADYAIITVEGDAIRWWPCTGALCTVGAPTAISGHLQPLNTSFTIYGYSNILNLRMIRVTTDSIIQVSYYRFITNVP